jgi:hypothetical protein
MDKGKGIINGLVISLLITFVGLMVILMPHLYGIWLVLVESVLGLWLFVMVWFLIIFRRFNKQVSKKGS